MTLLTDFKKFLLRGNVVDLAVGVVIGLAFGALITALVRDLLTPIIALLFGKHDFSSLAFTINNSTFAYGDFINYLIAFVSVAAAVFFFVVVPVNKLMARRAQEDPDTKECPECTTRYPSPHAAVPTARRSSSSPANLDRLLPARVFGRARGVLGHGPRVVMTSIEHVT